MGKWASLTLPVAFLFLCVSFNVCLLSEHTLVLELIQVKTSSTREAAHDDAGNLRRAAGGSRGGRRCRQGHSAQRRARGGDCRPGETEGQERRGGAGRDGPGGCAGIDRHPRASARAGAGLQGDHRDGNGCGSGGRIHERGRHAEHDAGERLAGDYALDAGAGARRSSARVSHCGGHARVER